MRLTPKGWVIFAIYCIAAIALSILTPQLLEGTQLPEYYILVGTLLYSIAVLGGVLFILSRYSVQHTKTANNN